MNVYYILIWLSKCSWLHDRPASSVLMFDRIFVKLPGTDVALKWNDLEPKYYYFLFFSTHVYAGAF